MYLAGTDHLSRERKGKRILVELYEVVCLRDNTENYRIVSLYRWVHRSSSIGWVYGRNASFASFLTLGMKTHLVSEIFLFFLFLVYVDHERRPKAKPSSLKI